MKLSVIIPVYNEEKTVLEVVRRVQNCGVQDLEIVIVDDCSTDHTAEELAKLPASPALKILRHEKNQGKGAAIRTAQSAVTGDAVIIQDADLEYDPSQFPTLFKPIEDGIADAVYGSRYTSGPRLVDTYFHYLGNLWLTTISNIFSHLQLTDMETCYKMIRREFFQRFTLQCNRFGFEPEITAKLSKAHARIYEVPIFYQPRGYEEGKKIGIRDAVAAVWYILKYNLFCK